MAFAGFKAQNHPQQVGKRGAKLTVDNLATTPEMFAPLHERFGFTIDAAALPLNTKPGRPRFIRHGFEKVEPNQRPPFGCCLLIWGAR